MSDHVLQDSDSNEPHAPTQFGGLRGQVLLALAAVCMLVLIGRLAYINAAMSRDADRLARHLAQQQRATIPLAARRGDILDAEGRVLAGSQQRPSVYADPVMVTDIALTADRLAPILEPRPERVRERARKIRTLLEGALAATPRKRFVWIERGLDQEQGKEVRKLIEVPQDTNAARKPKAAKEARKPILTGVGLLDEPFRRYPMHTVAAHVLGFVDIDSKGINGIEYKYDTVLTGTPGSMTVFCDASRRPMWPAQGNEALTPPRDGMTLKLTIDSALQEILESQVAGTVQQFKAQSGVGIVMNPKNGDVLALASVPTFDPNDPGSYDDNARRNRVLSDPAEPGSTFKPFVAAAALAEKVVKPGETIFCHNGVFISGARRLHDHHPYGDLTFEEIIIRSSNIGMAILGQRLGNDRLHRYLSAPHGFGFGSKTGIDLDGEDAGILLPRRKWTSFSTTSVPMGQEVAITPLQLATAFCAIVNGGKVIKPRVVRAILDPRGNVVQESREPQILRQVIPPDVAEYMTKTVLVGVVNDSWGTGKKARLGYYQVLGKTGTAQIAKKNGGGYVPDAYTSSFVAAAPASDPAVVVLIMIRQPQKSIGYYGGSVAAPPVREVISRSLAYMGVPPDKTPTDAPEARQARRGVASNRLAPEW